MMMRWFLMLGLGLGIGTGHAATLAQTCAAAKIKAAGFKVYAKTKCYKKALSADGTVDGACLSSAEQKFVAAFAKAEAGGGCTVTGDGPAVEAAVDSCVTTFTNAITGPRDREAVRRTYALLDPTIVNGQKGRIDTGSGINSGKRLATQRI